MNRNLTIVKWIAIFTLVASVIVGISLFCDMPLVVQRLFEWLDRIGRWAVPLFILVEILAVVLVLPGVILTLGAGFMFGVVKGSLYVIIGTTLGATLAFIIARYLFGERVSSYVLDHVKLKVIDDAVFKKEGLKIVILTRLVPFFPFKLTNYFFGLTQISLPKFFFGVLFGIIPITVNNVYIGSLAANLATLGSRNSRTHAEWAMYGIGFVIVLGTFAYITQLARKEFADHSSRGKSEQRGEP